MEYLIDKCSRGKRCYSLHNNKSMDTFDVESTMGRRKKKQQKEEKSRSLLMMLKGSREAGINSGKGLKHVNKSTDFFKEPGIIPGSSNILRERNKARKPSPDLVMPDESYFPLNKRLNYEEKEKIRVLAEEIKAVEEMDAWEASLRAEIERNLQNERLFQPPAKKLNPTKNMKN